MKDGINNENPENKQLLDKNTEALKNFTDEYTKAAPTKSFYEIKREGSKKSEEVYKQINQLTALNIETRNLYGPNKPTIEQVNNEISTIQNSLTNAIASLNIASDLDKGINTRVIKNPNDQQGPALMIRDTRARDKTQDPPSRSVNTELQIVLNNVRAALPLLVQEVNEPGQKTQPSQREIKFLSYSQNSNALLAIMKEATTAAKEHPDQELDVKNYVRRINEITGKALGVSSDEAGKKIQRAAVFTSLQDTNYHVSTVYGVYGKDKAYHTVVESDVLMVGVKGTTLENDYQIIINNKYDKDLAEPSLQWYNDLSPLERKLARENLGRVKDGQVILSNAALGVVPGLRNDAQKVVYMEGEEIGRAFRTGTPAHADPKDVKKQSTKVLFTGKYDLNDQLKKANEVQAEHFESFLGDKEKLVIMDLTSHNNRFNDLDKASSEGIKVMTERPGSKISSINRPFNWLRRFISNTKNDDIFKKHVINPVYLFLKSQALKGTMITDKGGDLGIKQTKTIHTIADYVEFGPSIFRPNEKKILALIDKLNTTPEMKTYLSDVVRVQTNKAKSPLFSRTNLNHDIASKEVHLLNKTYDLLNNFSKDEKGKFNKYVQEKIVVSVNCKSGKDRTGGTMIAFVVEAIATKLGLKVDDKEARKDIISRVVDAGLTQKSASINGGTRGCEGVKPGTAKNMHEDYAHTIDRVGLKTADMNKVKGESKEMKGEISTQPVAQQEVRKVGLNADKHISTPPPLPTTPKPEYMISKVERLQKERASNTNTGPTIK